MARCPLFQLQSTALGKKSLSNSSSLFDAGISLPIFPDMNNDQIKRVIAAVNAV